jgi:regulator of protease activity HflC (stomatin/prohibitin superfamily)
VREYKRAVIFRLGRLIGTKGPGLIFILPGIDKPQVVDLRTITYDARLIKIITKDNIRCDVDSFVYYRVVDPIKAVNEVEDYVHATQMLAKTVLRDVLGHAELDDLLTKTEEFTKNIQEEIDEMTNPWGIKVSSVAISDILLPEEMQRAIAKQAEAEREKRARIIVAEGEYIAAEKMAQAAEVYGKSPITLKLRELQTLTDISREKNLIVVTTTTDLYELGNIVAMARTTTEKKTKT